MAKKKNDSVAGCGCVLILFLAAGAVTALIDEFKKNPGFGIACIAIVIGIIVLIVVVASRSHANAVKNGVGASMSTIDNMTGVQFERFCMNLLEYNGFTRVSGTKATGDQGVDIIAWRNDVKYAIQCKRYSKSVGNRAVQEVYTGMAFYGCSRGIIITNSHFTSGAIEAARRTGIELWDRDVVRRLKS